MENYSNTILIPELKLFFHALSFPCDNSTTERHILTILHMYIDIDQGKTVRLVIQMLRSSVLNVKYAVISVIVHQRWHFVL